MTFFVHVILISCRSYSSKHSYLRSFLVHVNLSSYHSLFMLFLDHDILSSNNHDNMLFSVLAVLISNHSMFHYRKIISFYILRCILLQNIWLKYFSGAKTKCTLITRQLYCSRTSL